MDKIGTYLAQPVGLARRPLSDRLSFSRKFFPNLHNHMCKKFPGRELSKHLKEWVEWSLIISCLVWTRRILVWHLPVFTSVTKLLMERFETKNQIQADRRRAAWELRLGKIAFMLNLVSGGKYWSSTSRSGSRCLLTGRGCEVHAGHNGMTVTKSSSLGYVFILNGPELRKLLAR